jgi:hypothetical protein
VKEGDRESIGVSDAVKDAMGERLGDPVIDPWLHVPVTVIVLTEVIDCVRVRRRVLVDVPVTTWVEEMLRLVVGEMKDVLLTLPLREGVFDVVVL